MIDLFKTNNTNLLNNYFSKLLNQTIQSTELQDNLFPRSPIPNYSIKLYNLPSSLSFRFAPSITIALLKSTIALLKSTIACGPRNSFFQSPGTQDHIQIQSHLNATGEDQSICWTLVPNLKVPNDQPRLPCQSSTVKNRIIRCRRRR